MQTRRRQNYELPNSGSTAPVFASNASGLEFCGVKCIGNSVLGVVKDAFELGTDAFNSTLNLPSHVLDAINAVKHGVFDGWAEWVRLNQRIGKAMLNGLNAVYDGIVEIGKEAWVVITEACRLFKEYKDYINIGIQVIEGDYANAAANLAQEAAKALDIDSPVDGTDSEVVQVADFICQAVDGINIVTALAAGMDPPPPLAPTSSLVVEDGVARPMTTLERLKNRHGMISTSVLSPTRVKGIAIVAPQAPAKKSLAPTIVIGASVAAAFMILSR